MMAAPGFVIIIVFLPHKQISYRGLILQENYRRMEATDHRSLFLNLSYLSSEKCLIIGAAATSRAYLRSTRNAELCYKSHIASEFIDKTLAPALSSCVKPSNRRDQSKTHQPLYLNHFKMGVQSWRISVAGCRANLVINLTIIIQFMTTQGNLYPDLSSQPLLVQAPPPPPRANNPQPNYAPQYNQQGYPAANQAFPAYSNQPYQVPPPQPIQPLQQGFQQGAPAPINQGFQPNNNQGFSPNGPSGQLHCPFCGRWTESFPKKVAGGVTYIWCFALFLLTGIFCCIPFCVEGCKDTVMTCVICQGAKVRIEANCC